MNSPLVVLVILNLALAIADGLTTIAVLSQPGGYERAKLMKKLIATFGLKTGVLIGKGMIHGPLILILSLFAPWPVLILPAAFYAYIAIKNYRVYLAHKPV